MCRGGVLDVPFLEGDCDRDRLFCLGDSLPAKDERSFSLTGDLDTERLFLKTSLTGSCFRGTDDLLWTGEAIRLIGGGSWIVSFLGEASKRTRFDSPSEELCPLSLDESELLSSEDESELLSVFRSALGDLESFLVGVDLF